jgi:hypothetical protein
VLENKKEIYFWSERLKNNNLLQTISIFGLVLQNSTTLSLVISSSFVRKRSHARNSLQVSLFDKEPGLTGLVFCLPILSGHQKRRSQTLRVDKKTSEQSRCFVSHTSN